MEPLVNLQPKTPMIEQLPTKPLEEEPLETPMNGKEI